MSLVMSFLIGLALGTWVSRRRAVQKAVAVARSEAAAQATSAATVNVDGRRVSFGHTAYDYDSDDDDDASSGWLRDRHRLAGGNHRPLGADSRGHLGVGWSSDDLRAVRPVSHQADPFGDDFGRARRDHPSGGSA